MDFTVGDSSFDTVLVTLIKRAPDLRAVGVTRVQFGSIEFELASDVWQPTALDELLPPAKPSFDVPGNKCLSCGTNERRYGDLCRTCARGELIRGQR